MAINFLALASGASSILGALSNKGDPGLHAALGRAKAQRKVDIGRANLKGINEAIAISDDYRAVTDKLINQPQAPGIRSSGSQGAVLGGSIDKLSQNARIAYLQTGINVALADQAGQANIKAIQEAIKQSKKRGLGDIIGGLTSIAGAFGGG